MRAHPAPAPSAPPASGGSQHFSTLPIGAPLPSDPQCAGRVPPAPDVRPGNAGFNKTVGHPTAPPPPYLVLAGRVTGAYTGTTDELIQWTACKWGIDEDLVRAQVAVASRWHQTTAGDFTTDPDLCAGSASHPSHREPRGTRGP